MREIKFAEYSKIKLQLNYKLDVTAMHKQSLVHEVKGPWHLEAYCEGHVSY